MATAATQAFVANVFGTRQDLVSIGPHEFVPHLSVIASEKWMPFSIDGEADRCAFRFTTHAVAAIYSTPIRSMEPVGLQCLAGAASTHKHHSPPFNTHLAVAPNGIRLAILAILAGGRHEKRALDDTDAYLRFAYLSQTGTGGVL